MSNVVRRAFELAPQCATFTELKKRLKAEGLEEVDEYLAGLGTQKQLRARFGGRGGDVTQIVPRNK